MLPKAKEINYVLTNTAVFSEFIHEFSCSVCKQYGLLSAMENELHTSCKVPPKHTSYMILQYSNAKGEIFAGTGGGKHPGSQETGGMGDSRSLAERTENKTAAKMHKAYFILT